MTLALLSAWLARPGRVPPGPVRHAITSALVVLVIAWLPAASGCAHVEATPERVEVRTLGQVAVGVGCPATARPERGGTAEGGFGDASGSPCVAVQGAAISSQLGTVLGTLGGTVAGWLLR